MADRESKILEAFPVPGPIDGVFWADAETCCSGLLRVKEADLKELGFPDTCPKCLRSVSSLS